MNERMGRRTLLAAVLAATQAVCHQAILTAPAGSTISLIVNPGFIPAHGGTAVVSALIIEPSGAPVPDGTVVQFFTTLGTIEEQGKTNDGVARVNFVSDARSGTATVTALSGAVSQTADVQIGAVLPAAVQVTADPTRLRESRCSRIVANVFDAVGNPVASVPVIFTLSGDPAPEPSPSPSPSPSPAIAQADETETLASRSQPVFTDSNGQAVDELCTSAPRSDPPRFVTVTATTSNGTTGSVQVVIN